MNNQYETVKSDHNSIIIEIEGKTEQKNHKHKLWNIKNMTSWETYKEVTEDIEMKEKWETDDPDTSYKRWTQQIKSIMYRCLDRITVTPKETSEKVKILIRKRKEVTKEIKMLKNKGIKDGVVIDYLCRKQCEL